MATKYIPKDFDKPLKAKEDPMDRLYHQLGPWTKIGEDLWAGPRQSMGINLKLVAN